jgi:peptidoglycan/xylan/chitin deacetylase (PgdA/CDA1 family)
MLRSLIIVVLTAALSLAGAMPGHAEGMAMTAPATGAVLTGTVTLSADAPGAMEVAFDRSVDGGPWASVGTDHDGSDGWSVRWTTAPLDGPTIVRATAGEDVATVAVTLVNPPRVTLGVRPLRFSPNRDGRKDSTTIRVHVNEAASVRLRVVAASGNTRRSWTRTLEGAGRVTVVWAGRNGRGRLLPDTRYTVVARAVDTVGHGMDAGHPVVIDTEAPRIGLRLLTSDPDGGRAGRRFAIRVRDADPRAHGSLRVMNAGARTGHRIDLSLRSRRAERTWKPRSILYPGTYSTQVRLRDRAGNVGEAAPRAWRVHRSMRGRLVRHVDDVGRRVALTFDDCHFAEAWGSILRELRRRDLHASFFCPGQMLAAHPAKARRTIRDGHSPGSHGWDHADLTTLSDAGIRDRLLRDRAAWWRYGRATSAPYMRPPYGAVNHRVVQISGAVSMPRVVMWDVDVQDWRRPGTSALVASMADVRPGSIVVLHTIPETARALPAMLDALAERGLLPVSLDELYRARRG